MLIKGVNRRIVEVNAHGSFFEKAVLYVRPECTALTEEQLTDEAEDYVDMLSRTHKIDRRSRISLVTVSAAAAAGAAVSALLIIILGF